ncbi:hypothetical protein ACWIGM_09175 [Bosea sp. NPDC055332]
MDANPTKPGIYWAALDNGDEVVEVVLLRLVPYPNAPIEDGIIAEFFDGTGRYAEMKDFGQKVIQPHRRVVTFFVENMQRGEDTRITWLGKAKPPRGSVKPGQRIAP